MKKIKISELPQSESFDGLYTIGTDANNRSVKVPLGNAIQSALQAASASAPRLFVNATALLGIGASSLSTVLDRMADSVDAQPFMKEGVVIMYYDLYTLNWKCYKFNVFGLNADEIAQAWIDKSNWSVFGIGSESFPLPFIFRGEPPKEGEVYTDDEWRRNVYEYCRVTKQFYLNCVPLVEADRGSGYVEVINVKSPGGISRILRPNNKAMFTCGHKLYRFIGDTIVDVGAERSPTQNVVWHMPRLNAQPGYLYRNLGQIVIPVNTSCDNVYLYGNNALHPITSLTVFDYRHESIPDYWSTDISMIKYDCVFVDCGSIFGDLAKYIGVRYTADGKKIFYGVSGNFSSGYTRKPPVPTVRDVKNLLQINEIEPKYKYIVRTKENWNYDQLCLKYDIRIWRKANVGKCNQLHKKKRWSWRKFNDYETIDATYCYAVVRSKVCLVKIRKVGKRGKSDWAYFKYNLETGSIVETREQYISRTV